MWTGGAKGREIKINCTQFTFRKATIDLVMLYILTYA